MNALMDFRLLAFCLWRLAFGFAFTQPIAHPIPKGTTAH